MSHVLTFYRLQQIDSQTDRAYTRLNEIRKTLENDDSLKLSQDAEESASSELKLAESRLKQVEQEAQALKVKIEQTESTLYSGLVHTPKELQDLQNESAALKRYMTIVEDRLLDTMVALETSQSLSNETRESYVEVRAKWEKQNDNLLKEQSELNKDIQRLITERQAITESLPNDLNTQYEQLRKQHRGLAVTRIVDNACGSCGATLTPALIQAARMPNQISHCPSCGRILYAS